VPQVPSTTGPIEERRDSSGISRIHTLVFGMVRLPVYGRIGIGPGDETPNGKRVDE